MAKKIMKHPSDLLASIYRIYRDEKEFQKTGYFQNH